MILSNYDVSKHADVNSWGFWDPVENQSFCFGKLRVIEDDGNPYKNIEYKKREKLYILGGKIQQ